MTPGNWAIAVCLFRFGRDTLDIAEWFDVPESHIYNHLPRYLEQWRGKAVTLKVPA